MGEPGDELAGRLVDEVNRAHLQPERAAAALISALIWVIQAQPREQHEAIAREVCDAIIYMIRRKPDA